MHRFALPPDEPSTTAVWARAAFHDGLAAWCAEALGRGVRLENVKQRAWSTVWRVYAGEEIFYVKRNCSLQNFEAALVTALDAIVPGHVQRPVAVDLDEGFLLTPDYGEVLGDHSAGDVDVWCRIVAQWAEVQRAVAGRLDEVGLTTMRPEDAEEFVAVRTAGLAGLPASDPRRLSRSVAATIEAGLPDVRRWAEEVASLGLPLTLNHNDLHAWNVFVPRARGELRFFDFGDAVLAPPMCDLMLPLRTVRKHLEVDPGDPRLARIASAYLEAWSDLVPLAELRAALPACFHLAALGRHESWVRSVAPMNAEQLREYADAPTYWIAAVLQDNSLT